ncbi:hypothetical protein SARC_03251 [Sphaeroforma arctica JP610]|uniref:Uncharacterized protein n=1 Tax=Sphaeroforma arctica JP610 TaxID=667725 RepID=A0A0L0G667_9EUKA|nr:hypothetical protein SARC_03251 [Sphaeroforma arctica JP610]KNC84525.1 hypothetical protein SARC_03251 [Sphaeroforma arctica JP610]|eukprot:XP_014158427.1 hypothetical protein SARC_03251 [Sphaeroforma arctica JP610]
MELAQARNANPLHSVSQRPGIRLPPERYCLSAVNYQVDIDENDYNAEGIPATEPPKTATSTTTNTATNAATNSSTGASSSTDKPAQTAAGKFKKPAPAAISVQVAANAVENAYNGSGQAPAGFTMGAIKRSRDFSNDDDDDYD